VLVREYQGDRHTVTVVPNGYVWHETTYASLSVIARAITGTAWNGPRFFGLRSGGKPAVSSVVADGSPAAPIVRAPGRVTKTKPQLAVAFEAIESDLGSVDVLIYNAGKGVWGSAEEVTFEDFEAAWRTNTFGAFAAARSVIPAMKRRAAGHIIFVGATASRRGGAKTAAFASAKAAQRSLAESLARSLGPSKIHVSLIIIDGIVDEPSIRTKLADKLDSFFVKPDDIADTALMLTRQKPSAWTFELEARPFGETW